MELEEYTIAVAGTAEDRLDIRIHRELVVGEEEQQLSVKYDYFLRLLHALLEHLADDGNDTTAPNS